MASEKAGQYAVSDRYGDPKEFRPARHHGITYPRAFDNGLARWVAARTTCRLGWHLLDEVTNSEWEHFLLCDACDVMFGIVSPTR